MKFHELSTTSKKNPKRKGRGIAAGQGKTAGRGTKGQRSRSGGRPRPGFEGGQNPLLFRLPKLRGFKSHRQVIEEVTTGQLETIGVKKVTNAVLAEKGIVNSAYNPVKVITKGELTKPVIVNLQAVSVSAVDAIKRAGGSFEQVSVPSKPKKQAIKTTSTTTSDKEQINKM